MHRVQAKHGHRWPIFQRETAGPTGPSNPPADRPARLFSPAGSGPDHYQQGFNSNRAKGICSLSTGLNCVTHIRVAVFSAVTHVTSNV